MKTSALLPILVLSAMTLPAGSVLYAQATALPRPHKTARATGASPVLPKNIPPARGVMHTAYALKYIDVKLGTGELAAPNKFYTVQYTGWVASNGTKFDSSYDHGSAFTFPAGAHRVIPGWDTGFTGMHIGGKRRLFIPWQLAYGEAGRDPIPPRADLIFDIELLAVSDRPPAPPAPPQPPATPPPPTPPPPASDTPTPPASTAPQAGTPPQ